VKFLHLYIKSFPRKSALNEKLDITPYYQIINDIFNKIRESNKTFPISEKTKETEIAILSNQCNQIINSQLDTGLSRKIEMIFKIIIGACSNNDLKNNLANYYKSLSSELKKHLKEDSFKKITKELDELNKKGTKNILELMELSELIKKDSSSIDDIAAYYKKIEKNSISFI
jgi:predicted transcriptional regulator